MVVFETLDNRPYIIGGVAAAVVVGLVWFLYGDAIKATFSGFETAWDAFSVPLAVIAVAGGIVYLVAKPEARAALIEMFKDPNVLKDVGIAIATLLVLIGVYLYVLRPTIVMGKRTSIMQKCPDRWSFNPKNGYCEPRYETQCRPFKAGSKEVRSYSQQCDLAKSCGTNWGGVCE